MWSNSFAASWRAFCLLLALGGPCISLTAQSTINGLQQPDLKPKSVMVSVDSLLMLRLKIVDLENQSATLQQKLQSSEAIQQMLSESLTESSTKLELFTQASEARAALDQKAIDQARAQNWLYAGGGAAAVAIIFAVASLFHH